MDIPIEFDSATLSRACPFRRIFFISLLALWFSLTTRGETRDSLGPVGVDGTPDAHSALDSEQSSQLPAIPPALQRLLLAEHHPQRLLVRFRPGRGQVKRQALHQAARAKRVLTSFRYVDGLQLVEVGAGDLAVSLAAYSKSPDVLYAEPDYIVRVADVPNDPSFDSLWGLRNIGQTVNGDPGTAGADIRALQAWNFWAGDPDFRIAIIDTGVNYEHPDLAGNIWTNPGEIPGNGVDDDGNGWVDDIHGYDTRNPDGDPMDDHSHGSHTAGTIGAVANNNEGVVGVNWHCSIVGLKFLGPGGSGMTSDAVEAMEYVIDNGIRVSNNSWGGSGFSQALYDVIQASQAIGHIFVAAAGNSHANSDVSPMYPAAYDLPNIISVAATNNDDNRAGFSNYGPNSVDLGAPGVTILSTVLGASYAYKNGTSMASPHVTGVVALVMSRHPTWTWQQVKDRVLSSVRPVDSLLGITITGGVVSALNVGDCNENGIPDEDDISGGGSQDCSGNGTPDECEVDCNGNGLADSCDIFSGTSLNCNSNAVPDECEPDCNNNNVADSCDIAAGVSEDCDSNVIPDECTVAEGDCNNNGVPDKCDIKYGASSDCNNNGQPDECDLASGWAQDCNINSVPDTCDIISGESTDCDANTVPDECQDTTEDCNSNTIWDLCDIAFGLSADCDDNSIPDECLEPGGQGEDCNENLRPDSCELDCNGNLIPDDCDIESGSSPDCTGDAVPDECEPDCNGNGTADSCDIADGFSDDLNANGVPDECDVIVYVDENALGANDGTTWPDAFNDLQDGLDFAANPANGVTELWVARGVYTPDRGSGDPDETFQIASGVRMYGGFAAGEARLDGRDRELNETVLSGDLLRDDDPPRGFGTNACCDGGLSPTSCDDAACAEAVCAETAPFGCCDGVWTVNCAVHAVTICCDLCGNRCDNSHHVVTTSGTDESTWFDGFTITGGKAINLGAEGRGGGIYNVGGELTITNCSITGNSGRTSGGGMADWVGAATVSNSAFVNNVAPLGGGLKSSVGQLRVTNCAFLRNVALIGGGMFVIEIASRAIVTGSVFSGNLAGTGGGVASYFGAVPSLINCTITANTATKVGGGLHVHSGSPIITNTIIWDNADSRGSDENSQMNGHDPTISFSCVQGWTGSLGGISNSGEDPRFVDPAGADGVAGTDDDDLSLSGTSPYLDTGNNIAVPLAVTTDFSGRPRFMELHGVPDTGNGVAPIVDLGAYERWDDCNGNGVADEVDIADGMSTDCNGGGVPDECESTADCNANGWPDFCDILLGISGDCNRNGVPDPCDILSGGLLDDNGNGIPDRCEPKTPFAASYPHDRRKNRYISFDPNNADNDGNSIAFRIELKAITLGSCSGNGGFCRADRGPDDCNACSVDGNACINRPIDCAPDPPQSCNPTGQTCVNDAPDMGGTNVGSVWWVGPESPLNYRVHLLVSEPFRRVSDNWPSPVHVADCEVVPQAVYGVRAVSDDVGGVSDELVVETTKFTPSPGNAPFWWGDAVGALVRHCNADIREQTCDPNTSDGDCTGPATPAACCTGVSTGLCDCPGDDPCDRAWELPNGVTNVDDVTAALWTSAPAQPTTVSADYTWVDVHGNDSFTPGSQNFDPPNNRINVSDLQQIISGFGGFPYKFYDPADCPDESDWP